MVRPAVLLLCTGLLLFTCTMTAADGICSSCTAPTLEENITPFLAGYTGLVPSQAIPTPVNPGKTASAPASRNDTDVRLDTVEKYVARHNLSWTPGVTSVSNLSAEEFQQRLGVVHRPGLLSGRVYLSSVGGTGAGAGDLPETFDWRNASGDWTTPVKDQKGCGSCWAFTVTAVFESYWERLNKDPGLNPDFSEQYLVSCNREGLGCSGGDNHAFDYFVSKAGMSGGIGTVNESDFPYTGTNMVCRDLTGLPRFTLPAGQTWQYVINDVTVPPVTTLKQVIRERGPVAAYVYVTDLWQFYRGGILEDPSANPLPGQTNHAVVLVGWGHDTTRNKDYWIGKNSWGTDWGEGGWFRIYVDQARIGEGAAFLTMPSENPVPVLNRVLPDSVTAGGSGFTLHAQGTDFVAGAVVLWNGQERVTTYESGTALSAVISAADIQEAGSALVSVKNPSPGGGLSGTVQVTILPAVTPVPTTALPTTALPTTAIPTTAIPTTAVPTTVPTTTIPTPTPVSGPIRADFTWNPAGGPVPLTVAFTDNSSGPVERYYWLFGDGSVSQQRDPVHVYTTPGSFTVTLKVSGSGMSYRKTVSSCVIAGTTPTTVPTTPVPTTVTVTPTSLPTTVLPTTVVPTTVPTTPVPTTVTVTPTPVPGGPLAANFSASPREGAAPLTVRFTDLSSGSPYRWSWSFGDGSVSSEQNPVHIYQKSGIYPVSLRIIGAGGSYRKTIQGYITVS